MKKTKIFNVVVVTLIFYSLFLSACQNTNTSTNEIVESVSGNEIVENVSDNNSSTTVGSPINEAETQPSEYDLLMENPTEPISRYGCNGVYVYDLIQMINDGEEFFVYIETNENNDEDLSNTLLWAISDNNLNKKVVDSFYIVDLSTLNSAEQDSILNYFVPGTVYAVKGNEVVSAFSKIPEKDSEDYIEKYHSLFQTWVYSTFVSVDNHGLETIAYETILGNIENKESFCIYIGRDSCKYCRVFTPTLEAVLEDNELNCDIYYFFTQDYKNAIENDEDGAQEKWDSVKENLGIKYTPSFIFYKDGEPIYYENFTGSEYFDAATTEEKNEIMSIAYDNFIQFLNNNEVIKNQVETQSTEECEDSEPCE